MFYWVRLLCNNTNVNLLYLEVQAGSPCILVGVNAPYNAPYQKRENGSEDLQPRNDHQSVSKGYNKAE